MPCEQEVTGEQEDNDRGSSEEQEDPEFSFVDSPPPFKSEQWPLDDLQTPEVTPGAPFDPWLASETRRQPLLGQSLTYGVHWNKTSYPAWTGAQVCRDERLSLLAARDECGSYPADSAAHRAPCSSDALRFKAPFSVDHIAASIDMVRRVLGFQFDASVSVFELLMSQLDSRAARSSPRAALLSLQSDYISGSQANYRKWYFASQMDKIDLAGDAAAIDFAAKDLDAAAPEADESKPDPFVSKDWDDDHIMTAKEIENLNLQASEAIWNYHEGTRSDGQRLVDVIIYLSCWTEANQVRFMPECLAFIVKACRDHYFARSVQGTFPTLTTEIMVPDHFFLDKVVTPIYECYRHYNFRHSREHGWVRREGDHKDFIGYDDMNQLFWYRGGLKRLKLKFASSETSSSPYEHGQERLLVDQPVDDWYTLLPEVEWTCAFRKTYRESRTWLHNITNFSRMWILHASVFWYYTCFNSPTLYTPYYDYTHPTSPRLFVRLTLMSLGGLIGPFLTIVALVGELRFVPFRYPGSKPVLPRLVAVLFTFCLLAVPAVLTLMFMSWEADREESTPANIVSGVLLALAILYTCYYSCQPLDAILGHFNKGYWSRNPDKSLRRFLANRMFTANFPAQNKGSALLSWMLCFGIFLAKFIESYFFLTLSVRDPIRELGIMCHQSTFSGDVYAPYVSLIYTRLILVGIVLTDMTLFLLDTYLWYVIFCTVVSVAIAFRDGISVWSPWRNKYSRLSQRICAKLLETDTCANPKSTAFAIRVVWTAIVTSMRDNHIMSAEQAGALLALNGSTQEPKVFACGEDNNFNDILAESSAANRRISFFAQSLSTPMRSAPPVAEMPAFTVLIPHYKEKMIVTLKESLTVEEGADLTILEYLQRRYPQQWQNYVQELDKTKRESFSTSLCHGYYEALDGEDNTAGDATQSNNIRDSLEATQRDNYETSVNKRAVLQQIGFGSLDPNETQKTRLWCSERTQTLYRTLKGFANYYPAIRVLGVAEEELRDESSSSVSYEVNNSHEVAHRKATLLVSMQLYSCFTRNQLDEVETLLSIIPELRICYVQEDKIDGCLYSCITDASCPLMESGFRAPRLRIRLSGNPFMGDGKSDNQNCALPFYRGEYIQLVDANQDNYLEECLKIRNILEEFEPNAISPGQPCTGEFGHTNSTSATCSMGPWRSDSILDSNSSPPVAIVGAREYIFSENLGIIGDVAAGKEQTFGTLFSRTLAKVDAKLHYGHPDFLNAVYMTTRGGVSKGQRGLHLNEDIYAGITATVRGGRIRHSEYYQCGKGRDLGFVSVLNFTAKIGAGMGEQMLSREYFQLGTQLPFHRFVSFYFAHAGFHINNALIMMSLEMLMMLILWITSLGMVNTVCVVNKNALASDKRQPEGCVNIRPLINWVQRCVLSIILVFVVSLCPLFIQEMTERGIFRSMKRVARHFCSLSMLFEIFACRIYARTFWEDINFGGARYLATGRGLATTRLPFASLYAGYHAEIARGLQGAGQLLFASIALWSPTYLWFWLTTFSFCFCPSIYNPHQFNFSKFFVDYKRTLSWFWEATTSGSLASSWNTFDRETRVKLTGVRYRTRLQESSRPSFRNSLFFQVGAALLNLFGIGVAYIYVSTTSVDSEDETPIELNTLLRTLAVAAAPLALGLAVVPVCFVMSLLSACIGTRKLANTLAMVSHLSVLVGLFVVWWALCALEQQDFPAALLGFMTITGVYRCMWALFTVLLLFRERSCERTNTPWWTGDWSQAKLGWKLVPVVFQELMIKSLLEPLDFAYDFLGCHIILALQVPLLAIPYVDSVHTLFLLWVSPAAAKSAHEASTNHQRRTSWVFLLVFLLTQSLLIFLVVFPLVAPQALADRLNALLRSYLNFV